MHRFLGGMTQPIFGNGRLGQANTCEPTPEGGMRCADGTYLPPGCAAGSPQTVQAEKPGTNVWPYVAAAGALAAGAAIALSGRKGMGLVPTLETNYPAVAADLRAIAGKINGERAADAWNFSQMQEAGKKKYDLLFQQKAAEERLRDEEIRWGQSHRNLDSLQAATAEVDRLNSELAEANAKVQDYRGYLENNAAAILSYRQQADGIIAGLPAEVQAEARRIIDPCYRSKMSGAFLGQVGIANRVPGGYGVEYGTKKAKKLPTDMIPTRAANRWRPYMGQVPAPAPAAAVQPVAPGNGFDAKSLAGAGLQYGLAAGVGAIIGLVTNLVFPSTRMPKKDAVKGVAIGAGAAALGTALSAVFGEKQFFRYMVGVGGYLTGSYLMDVVNPGPRQICVPAPEPKLSGRSR